jgi:nucleoid-associated protein YgaU
LGGTDVTTARLTPRIGETFERSSRVARRVPISVAPKVSSPEPRLTNAAVGSHRRLGGQWWRSVVALAAVLAAAGLFAMNARTADPPAPSTLPVSVPSGLATASQPVAPSPQTSALQTYTVKIGDSLTSIAADVYGDESLWPLIHEANRAAIPDPDNLRVGQPLVIPQR